MHGESTVHMYVLYQAEFTDHSSRDRGVYGYSTYLLLGTASSTSFHTYLGSIYVLKACSHEVDEVRALISIMMGIR